MRQFSKTKPMSSLVKQAKISHRCLYSKLSVTTVDLVKEVKTFETIDLEINSWPYFNLFL